MEPPKYVTHIKINKQILCILVTSLLVLSFCSYDSLIFCCLQHLLGSYVVGIQSNGFSFHLGKREKREEGDQAEPHRVGTGKPLVHLAMFILLITESLGWRNPWCSTKEKLLWEEKPNGRWMSTEPSQSLTNPTLSPLRYTQLQILRVSVFRHHIHMFNYDVRCVVEMRIQLISGVHRIWKLSSIWSTSIGEWRNRVTCSSEFFISGFSLAGTFSAFSAPRRWRRFK